MKRLILILMMGFGINLCLANGEDIFTEQMRFLKEKFVLNPNNKNNWVRVGGSLGAWITTFYLTKIMLQPIINHSFLKQCADSAIHIDIRNSANLTTENMSTVCSIILGVLAANKIYSKTDKAIKNYLQKHEKIN